MTIREAVKEIDAVFGAGFAKANPGLVGEVLRTDALEEIDKTLAAAVEHMIDVTTKVNLGSLISGLFK